MPVIAKHPSTRKKTNRRRIVRTAQLPSKGDLTQGEAPLKPRRHRISELEAILNRFREQTCELHSSLDNAREQRSHFLELFENAPVGYVVHDSDGFILEANQAASLLLGFKYPAQAKTSLTQFLTEGSVVGWLTHIRECRKGRKQRVTELTFRTPDRSKREIELVTLHAPTVFPNRPDRFHTILKEIGRNRETERQLNQLQLDYQKVIDMVEGIVWEANARPLKFTYVSAFAQRLLGYPLAAWAQPDFLENRIYSEDRERVMDQILRAVSKRTELRLDYRVVAADRRVVWLHDSIKVIERSGMPALLGVAVDVTEQRLAEEQIREAHTSLETKVAERTAELRNMVSELEAFSYSLSHDMRAPIRAMRGYAELLQDIVGDKLGPKVPEFLRRIMSSAERLDLLVQDVLQFSRVARMPIRMKPLDLESLLHNILNDYPELAPGRARVEIHQPLLPILGHEAFVGQALSNLLTNAVKFMPPGQTPEVHLWTEKIHNNGMARLTSVAQAGWVRIWVQDNGLGIASEDQKRIFGIFERVQSPQDYAGTGIGLAIVQKAVERMGGRVGVESVPGQGSKFWIELPPA